MEEIKNVEIMDVIETAEDSFEPGVGFGVLIGSLGTLGIIAIVKKSSEFIKKRKAKAEIKTQEEIAEEFENEFIREQYVEEFDEE